jgi:NDP-sugar pyrophosphorylase family protein
MMKRREPSNETAVILCGGKARRLGSLGERVPKSLALVRGNPILWYIFFRLHQAGFRHFILPLGHLGNEIRNYVERELRKLDASLELIETGDETPISGRLSQVRHAIGSENFLLINGDTLFDFDVAALMARHKSSGAELTLTSGRIVSQYGLLLVDEADRPVDFVSGSTVTKLIVDGHPGQGGFVNAGIAALGRHTLAMPGVDSAPEFEQFLYRKIIASGGARHYAINGFWCAIDTQKDLDVANSAPESDPRAIGTQLLADKLAAYARELEVSQ